MLNRNLDLPGRDRLRNAVHRGEGGFALVAVLLILVVMAGLAAAMQLTGRTELRIGTNQYTATRSYYAAEAGAEKFIATVREKMGYGYLTPEDVAEAAQLPPDVPGYTFTDFSAVLMSDVVARQIPLGPYAGLTSLDRDLTITSSVEGPDGTRATVTMDARAQAIPIFQFAIFYDDDLEILPGPRMDVRGRVHTNGELWIDGGDGLYLHSVVTSAGDLHLERKGTGGSDGTSNFIQLNDDSFTDILLDTHAFGGDHDPATFPSEAQDKAFDDYSKASWDHNIQTRASGLTPLRLPIPEGVDPYVLTQPCTGAEDPSVAAIKYSCSAGLTIRVRGTTLEVLDEGGAPIALDPNAVKFRVNRFYDDREQSSNAGNGNPGIADNFNSDRDVIDINLKKFSGADYQNGIFYVTADPTGPVGGGVDDAEADEQQYVVRVRGGARLKRPLTIATELPMYIRGDYNSNDADWEPASLVADALTILSNNWSDGAAGEGARPDASDLTKIQAAILAGHTPSVLGGQGGGQFENFPRFLEYFGASRTVTINGSFVSLWYGQYTDSQWGCCIYYNPPRRDWNFDGRFLDPENLPLGTPTVGQVLRMGFARRY